MKSRLEKLDPNGNFSLCLVSFVGTVGLSALMILPITVVVAGQFSNLVGNSMGPAMAALLVGGGEYVPAIWMACGLFVASLLPMLAIARLVVLPTPSRST